MSRLVWNATGGANGDGMGSASSGAVTVTLANPPALGFVFDALDYDSGVIPAYKVVNGATLALFSSEMASVAAYLSALGGMNNAALVWGLDAAGVTLGLVAASAATSISTPQPTPIGAYRWTSEGWAHV